MNERVALCFTCNSVVSRHFLHLVCSGLFLGCPWSDKNVITHRSLQSFRNKLWGLPLQIFAKEHCAVIEKCFC
jgi:hypothetical protein